MKNIDVTSIIANNSAHFVKSVFKLYADKKVFLIEKSKFIPDAYPFLNICERIVSRADHGWIHLQCDPFDSDDLAQLVFTSGTEGVAKVVLLSYSNLANVTRRLVDVMEMDGSVREYVGVPVFYSFGLGRCRAIAAVGGAIYIPPSGFNPLELLEMIQKGEVNAISAVPSLWRILLDSAELFVEVGKQVRWIEIGSQYMSASEKQRMRQLFPYAKIIQHYGLTEASRATFLDINIDDEVLLESVGKPTGDVAIKINEIGNICIRGGNVAVGYIDNTGQTIPLINDTGWFETKDVGKISGKFLWFLGRSDDQVNIGGVKISPEALEQKIIENFYCSNQIAIAGIGDRLRGMKLIFAYQQILAPRVKFIEKYIYQVLQSWGVSSRDVLYKFSLDVFPITETGKVQRKKISALYEQYKESLYVVGDLAEKSSLLSPKESALAEIWRGVLGSRYPINPDDSFIDIGGDSLSTLQVIIKMQKNGYSQAAIQKMMRGRTLAAVVAASSVSFSGKEIIGEPSNNFVQKTVVTWSLSALRGIMVGVVLLAHWGPGVWRRLFGEFGWEINTVLSPVYRMGTPGFAMVFGVGVGYYFVSQGLNYRFLDSAKRVFSIFLLVFFSWVLLSGLRFVESLLGGQLVTTLLVANSFYSVLCYYVLGIASIPLWIFFLKSLPFDLMKSALVISFLCWISHLFLVDIVSPGQIKSLFELPRLMLTAKYSYFRISTIVFIGIAFGSYLKECGDLKKISEQAIWGGVICFFGGLV